MTRSPRTAWCVFLLLLVLACPGCGSKENTRLPGGTPALLADPLFLADLARARERLGGITVVAPSSGLREDNIPAALSLAASMGADLPPEALDSGAVPYNANSDEARLRLLVAALADPGAGVIWALLGGYGSSRLLEEFSRESIPAEPKKIVIGYSDTTFLHLYFQRLGWRTVHGSLLWELTGSAKDERNFRLLAAVLAGRTPELRYDGLEPYNHAARNLDGAVEGPLTGGNLTCVAAACGTPWAVDAAGKVLFLEDVREPGYKVDRMLTQLRAAGSLDGVRAVILGSFTAGDSHVPYALERFAADCPVPVLKTDLFGHGPKNYPLIFNAPARIVKNSDGNFRLVIRADVLP